MELRKNSNRMVPKIVVRSGSREAIVEAASRLFLQQGFGAVSMDELAKAAGVARRTLYNQFASKEEIFREMLLKVSGQLEHAFPPGVETQGGVEEVLRLVARMILELNGQPEYLGFLRMVVADSRQFPWIAEEFAAVMDPLTERLARYVAHLTAMGVLECRQSDAGGSPVHGYPQRVLAVALDDRSRAPGGPGRRDRRRDSPDVPSALPAARERTKRVMTTQRNSN